MRPELIARYDRRVPRYTSYPTAPHFHAGVDASVYRDWLGELGGAAGLSLYVHVPFCARMCRYCGCHTRVVARYEPIAEYLETLLAEARLVRAAMGGHPPLVHAHWGGGTPTILSAPDIRRLADGLRETFGVGTGAEFAVEIDPRGLDEERVAALAAAGVTRASLGVQDCNPAVQAAIDRHQPFELTARAVERLRERGIGAINLDLMYGLPRQTVADVARTVDLCLGLAPDRVALFGYAHVPWMKKHQRLIDEGTLPRAAERWAQAREAARRLAAAGYRAIGLDHFARPGDPLAEGPTHRNFQGYTTDPAEALIGLGASAIGALPQGYAQNAVPVGVWRTRIERGGLATVRGVALDADDRLRRAVIERLMCDLAVDLAEAARAHGATTSVFDADLPALAPMVADGLARIEGTRVTVTEEGRPFVRVAAAAFDRYLRADETRHARAV
jgi:oxygen-independent coproporphyrinogen-3 oxidase